MAEERKNEADDDYTMSDEENQKDKLKLLNEKWNP